MRGIILNQSSIELEEKNQNKISSLLLMGTIGLHWSPIIHTLKEYYNFIFYNDTMGLNNADCVQNFQILKNTASVAGFYFCDGKCGASEIALGYALGRHNCNIAVAVEKEYNPLFRIQYESIKHVLIGLGYDESIILTSAMDLKFQLIEISRNLNKNPL